jgi:DNA repair protein RecO (recombination protein O)
MRERVYRTEAIILRRSDFSEADRLLLMATPAGKRRVIAKGVRKTTSRLAGHIELFTHTTMLLAIGRNLDIVTQSQIISSFPQLRSDLERISCAYYVAELYDKSTEEEEENRPLFQLMAQTIRALDSTTHPDLVLRWFELNLLGIMGYRPHFHRCVACNELLDEQADRFSPLLGGMLCPRCGPSDRNAIPVSTTAFKLLRYLQNQPSEAVELMNISPEPRAEAAVLLRAHLRHLLERDLKSAAFLEEVSRSV